MKHKVCLLSLCLISVLIGTCLSACEGTPTTTTANEGQSLGDIVNNEGVHLQILQLLVLTLQQEFITSLPVRYSYFDCWNITKQMLHIFQMQIYP